MMYLHGFCKVVTSVLKAARSVEGCTCMDFVRLLHLYKWIYDHNNRCTCMDFVRLLHLDRAYQECATRCTCMDFVRLLHPQGHAKSNND